MKYAGTNGLSMFVYGLRGQLNQIKLGPGICVLNVKGFEYRLDASDCESSLAEAVLDDPANS